MQEIFVPALGMASDSVHLTEWLKQPGDSVELGEAVAGIETDKAELEVPSPASGTLGRHRYDAGAEVPSGATITVVLDEGEIDETAAESDGRPSVADEAVAPKTADAAADQNAPVDVGRFPPATTPVVRAERVRDAQTGELEPYSLSPRARREVLGARSVRGADAAEGIVAEQGSPADTTERHRSAIAAAVSRSWAEIPHFAVQRELRVERMQELHRSLRVIRRDVTFTDVLLKAYALALMEHVGSRDVHLGLAVATDRGVSIPIIRDVARLDVLDIADRRRAAVDRARAGRLSEDDGTVAHSTVSNLGGFSIDSFTAIIPVGQTSILSVGRAALRPVVEDGVLAVGTTMHATLNVDHREWDGEHAAEVLQRLEALAVDPLLIGGLSR